MGQIFYGIDVAAVVNAESGHFGDVTLTSIATGARTTSTEAPAKTRTTHAAKGFVEDYTDSQIDGTLIQAGDRKVYIVANSIIGGTVPKAGMEVTVASIKYVVVRVQSDPSTAGYTCQVRASN